MKLFLFFKRDHPKLAKAEARSLANKVLHEEDELVIANFNDESFKRLVLTKYACELLDEVSRLDSLYLPKFKSFAVRCNRIGRASISCSKVESNVGARIEGKVDLKDPETIIRVFTDGKKFYITKQLFEYSEKEFMCRRVNARPFFHPTSLQPKWARLLLNLSGVKKGRVLDPFCGAGGILLEAGVLGLKATGVEKDEITAEGARENLWFFRVDDKCKVINADFLEWKSNIHFDAIVTDLPYGKSSLLFGRKLNELYEKSFRKMHKHSNKAVIMGPRDLTKMLTKYGWEVRALYDLYVHRSLRRWIHICQSSSKEV